MLNSKVIHSSEVQNRKTNIRKLEFGSHEGLAGSQKVAKVHLPKRSSLESQGSLAIKKKQNAQSSGAEHFRALTSSECLTSQKADSLRIVCLGEPSERKTCSQRQQLVDGPHVVGVQRLDLDLSATFKIKGLRPFITQPARPQL